MKIDPERGGGVTSNRSMVNARLGAHSRALEDALATVALSPSWPKGAHPHPPPPSKTSPLLLLLTRARTLWPAPPRANHLSAGYYRQGTALMALDRHAEAVDVPPPTSPISQPLRLERLRVLVDGGC